MLAEVKRVELREGLVVGRDLRVVEGRHKLCHDPGSEFCCLQILFGDAF